MPDAITPSASYVLKQSLEELRAAIEGVPAEALNWKPGGDETNSIAVLATHVMHSTRSWLSVAVGAELPERDRASEFRVTEDDPGALLRLVDEMSEECRGRLRDAGEVDWSAVRKTHARPGDAPETVPAAFALLHALEHLGQHVAHCSLTRQLWEEQGARSK
ncbi:MAG TPA: DinB family protein [Dehalococcoidia bacterium]|nr:DinB family protein [Dehalococcoidia bacterium]